MSHETAVMGMVCGDRVQVGDKRGISTMRLSKYIDGTYGTAWRMVHKLRMVMKEGGEGCKKLEGVVEFDDSFFGGKGKGTKGRGARNKVKVFVAVESRAKGRKAGRVMMKAVERHDREHVKEMAVEALDTNASIKTDNAAVYRVLEEMGVRHEHVQTLPRLRVKEFPWVHRMISLAKRWILGMYHGVSKTYFQCYLDEFCYRMNRRYEGQKIIVSGIFDCVKYSPVRVSEVLYNLEILFKEVKE